MAVKVNKTYETDKITLRYISGLGWELIIGNERIHLNQEKFDELKAVMAEILHIAGG